MNTIQLTIPDKDGAGVEQTYSGASTWSELSEKQYWAVCKVLLLVSQHDFLRLTLPSILYGIEFDKLQFLFNVDLLTEIGLPDELVADALDYGQQLLASTDWVFETLPQAKWPVPTLEINKHFVYGPGDGLRNCTFEEFIFAEKCWSKYRATNNPSLLLKLIAILMRQKKHKVNPEQPDQRQPFDPHWVERNTRRFEGLSHYEKWGILLAYESARTELASNFEYVFQKPTEGQKTPSAGWYEVALSMAGKSVKTFEENSRANVYLVLALLNKAIQEQENAQ